MYSERLPYSMRRPIYSLVLIAQAVFLSEDGHTHADTKSQMPLFTLSHEIINVYAYVSVADLYRDGDVIYSFSISMPAVSQP